MIDLSSRFPAYTDNSPDVPVHCVTPGEGRTIHRFFDTSPFSPSGRYMALFRLPYEDRLAQPGDSGDVLVVDLLEGTEAVVAQTRGWEPQMGPNLQWGADDETLLFNDVDCAGWQPHIVKLQWRSGDTWRLPGHLYHVSPDGRFAVGANMLCMRRTQSGYGVVVPDDRVPRNVGLTADDGLYMTDLDSGRCRLLVSLRSVVEQTAQPDDLVEYAGREVYGFHSKWNSRGDRLIFTVRHFPDNGEDRFDALATATMRFDVYTLRPDGSDVRNAVPAVQWDKGGHHINWFPDGDNLSMNLNIDRRGMRFVRCRFDGTGLCSILESPVGSGHPTVHPDGRHILTDAYPAEPVAYADGSVPLRLIDIATGSERELVRMQTATEAQSRHPALRVDPHPAWDRSFRYVAFNGYADGTRRVYVADLGTKVDTGVFQGAP